MTSGPEGIRRVENLQETENPSRNPTKQRSPRVMNGWEEVSPSAVLGGRRAETRFTPPHLCILVESPPPTWKLEPRLRHVAETWLWIVRRACQVVPPTLPPSPPFFFSSLFLSSMRV